MKAAHSKQIGEWIEHQNLCFQSKQSTIENSGRITKSLEIFTSTEHKKMQPLHLNYNNNKRLTEWEAEIERIRGPWIDIAIDLITLELSQKRLCRNINHFGFFYCFQYCWYRVVCCLQNDCSMVQLTASLYAIASSSEAGEWIRDALPIKICSTALCLNVMYFLSISPIILAVI